MSAYREQENEWLKSLDITANRVLDVGAGDEAHWAKNRVGKLECETYVTLDWDRKLKPNVVYNLNYFKHAEDVFGGERFDVIFCLNVFEYIWNPVYAIHCLWDWLNPKGTLYASFPFVYPVHEPAGFDYLRYTEEGIARLLIEPFGRGFGEYQITPRYATKGKDLLLNFYRLEGMHSAKNRYHDVIGWNVVARK